MDEYEQFGTDKRHQPEKREKHKIVTTNNKHDKEIQDYEKSENIGILRLILIRHELNNDM